MTNRFPSDRTRRIFLFVALIALLPVLYGCPAIQINVGRGDEGSFSHPTLQNCPGVKFEITVIQYNSVDQTTKRVTVEGTVAAGRATFKSRELRDLDLTNIVTIELKVVNVPNNPGTVECPYRIGEIYITPPLILKKLDETTYGVDADKFTRKTP